MYQNDQNSEEFNLVTYQTEESTMTKLWKEHCLKEEFRADYEQIRWHLKRITTLIATPDTPNNPQHTDSKYDAIKQHIKTTAKIVNGKPSVVSLFLLEALQHNVTGLAAFKKDEFLSAGRGDAEWGDSNFVKNILAPHIPKNSSETTTPVASEPPTPVASAKKSWSFRLACALIPYMAIPAAVNGAKGGLDFVAQYGIASPSSHTNLLLAVTAWWTFSIGFIAAHPPEGVSKTGYIAAALFALPSAILAFNAVPSTLLGLGITVAGPLSTIIVALITLANFYSNVVLDGLSLSELNNSLAVYKSIYHTLTPTGVAWMLGSRLCQLLSSIVVLFPYYVGSFTGIHNMVINMAGESQATMIIAPLIGFIVSLAGNTGMLSMFFGSALRASGVLDMFTNTASSLVKTCKTRDFKTAVRDVFSRKTANAAMGSLLSMAGLFAFTGMFAASISPYTLFPQCRGPLADNLVACPFPDSSLTSPTSNAALWAAVQQMDIFEIINVLARFSTGVYFYELASVAPTYTTLFMLAAIFTIIPNYFRSGPDGVQLICDVGEKIMQFLNAIKEMLSPVSTDSTETTGETSRLLADAPRPADSLA